MVLLCHKFSVSQYPLLDKRWNGKNLVRTCFSEKTQKTQYCGIKNPCSAENRSAFFENVLSKDSIPKISVHTDDIDSGATLSELDFRPSSKHWSHFTEQKIFKNTFLTTFFVTFNSIIWLVTFQILLYYFCNVSDFPLTISCSWFLYIACGLQFVESSFSCFYIPCSLYRVKLFSFCYFNACD